MFIREYSPEDYPMLMEWWKGHGWAAVSSAVLPKFGIIAEVDKIPVCSGFLYMDNSVGVCFLEWVATNPTAKKKEAMLAMKYMIEFMGIRAKELDYGMMLTSASENIVKAYKFCGFVDPKSPAHYHLFKPL